MSKTLTFLLAFLLVGCSATTLTPSMSPTPSGSPTNDDPCGIGQIVMCVLNPDVTQDTINSTICVSGWTSTIRPPTSYTEPIKLQLISEGQNLVSGDTNASDYELDHRMPLELGGAPKDLNNLSVEYPHSTNPKDSDENYYKKQVCSGAMTLLQAQQALISKWLLQYPGYKQ